MSNKIKVTAKAFGTVNSVDGSIIHCNPRGSDPAARRPLVDVRDVPRLLEAGLINKPKGYVSEDAGEEMSVADAAARQLEEHGEGANDTNATVVKSKKAATDDDDGSTPPA